MAKKIKETQVCMKCGEPKKYEDYYISYSPLHMSGRCPLCKECISKYDANNLTEVISVLRTIDRPYYKDLWEKAVLTGKDNIFGKYMRMLSLNNSKDTWADGEVDESKSITRMNTEIMRKQMELEQLEEKAKNIQKEEENKIPDELIKKWGKGYDPELYQMFEDKFKLLEQSYPIRSSMHLESLMTYVILSTKAMMCVRQGNVDEAQKFLKLSQEQAKQAKINPSALSVSDLAGGIDNFSSLVMAVEKAVDIVPLIPKYIEQGQDKADMMILFYVNYERSLRGLPEVEHKDVYDFYNKMIESYIENNPDDYAFLKDTDESLPLVNRVYDWVFNVRIPEEKKNHPNDPFYQNLEKWVEFVSYMRWYPDSFYRLITPKEGGIKLGLDQCIMLRGLARFKHLYDVQGRGSGKTFIEQLFCYHNMTFYSYLDIAMSAQTLGNASSLVKDKFTEIMKFYPMLKNECVEKECRFTENNTIVMWKNGSSLTTLANAQSSKGQRRRKLLIEESAQCSEKLYEDVLEPIVYCGFKW